MKLAAILAALCLLIGLALRRPRTTALTFDVEYGWLIEDDDSGCSRIVARDVLPEWGRAIADAVYEPEPSDDWATDPYTAGWSR